jgi:hypothetical protein
MFGFDGLSKNEAFFIFIQVFSIKKPGNGLLSHTVTHVVPSALGSLTSVFGMGTGVSSPPLSPGYFFYPSMSPHLNARPPSDPAGVGRTCKGK